VVYDDSEEEDSSSADDADAAASSAAIEAAATVQETRPTERTRPAGNITAATTRRYSRRAASAVAAARNRALLCEDETNPEVYKKNPERLYDAIVYKWIPYHYGDDRDNRAFTYGDENEGERHFARVIGYKEPFWRIQYQIDNEVEDCTLDEILQNLYSKPDKRIGADASVNV